MDLNFLPVAVRELRAAARRKNTRRLRWWAAVIAIIASFLCLASNPVSAVSVKITSSLFTLQTACAFALALLSGAFLTSDSLSEEKRDGTLGLLFLTDLTARDIVLGKFVATSVNAICGLLAMLPVTAVPLLLGGVGLAEFWRVALALVNTLFFSLAVGLCVSAFVKDYARSVAGTLGLLALSAAGFSVVPTVASASGRFVAWSVFRWLSPFYPFLFARDATYVVAPREFWTGLIASHSLAWVFLALAAAGLHHSSQEKKPEPKTSLFAPKHRRAPDRITHLRRSSSQGFDPVLYLAGDGLVLRWAAWLIVAAWGVLLLSNQCWRSQGVPDLVAAKAGVFILKVLVAFQACRFFVETRRSGALEVLLCTPLRNAELITAQWRLLLRSFFWPLTLFLLMAWINLAFPLGTPPLPPGRTTFPAELPGLAPAFTGVFFLTIGTAADFLATGWFGMWLALTVRKPGVAPALTVLAVLVLPALMSRFDLVADMLFISWGVTRFHEDFRSFVTIPLRDPEQLQPT